MNLESLNRGSLSRLGEGFWEGVLPIEREQEPERQTEKTLDDLASTSQGREVRGVPWFEEMVEGSTLGRIRRRRGGETSQDGRTRVEWEVVEFDGGEDDSSSGMTGIMKRKIGDVGNGDDLLMRGGSG